DADLMALDKYTGRLPRITTLAGHSGAIVTGSPVAYRGVAYVGVSRHEESVRANPAYPCCTFRGSVVAVSTLTGRLLWKTYTVPFNGGKPGGYSGGAVWGSTAVIDPATGLLYVGTGNNDTVPAGVGE